MDVLDLFSGIGGFSLGLERAGMRTIAFCEINPFCRAVLAKHWPSPDVWIFGDIRTTRFDCIRADVICGGFPCQDISFAGKGAGIDGARSGLWSEYARVIGEVRPRYVIVENVAALLVRGIERVLGDLAALGYDAEWHCIPASAIGAPHRRDRLWIVAYPAGERQPEARIDRKRPQVWIAGSSKILANPNRPRLSPPWPKPEGADWRDAGGMLAASDWWGIEPNVGRVAHGVPDRVDRLTALGNAIVPQIAEIIGRAILSVN